MSNLTKTNLTQLGKLAATNQQLDLLTTLKGSSTFDSESACKHLNTYIEYVKTDLETLSKRRSLTHDNLSSPKQDSLNNLIKKVLDKQITIALAEKGGGIVIVVPEMYSKKGNIYFEEQQNLYTLVDVKEDTIIQKIVKARNNIIKLLIEAKVITPKHRKFITSNLQPKITGIKFDFKVHKTFNIVDI